MKHLLTFLGCLAVLSISAQSPCTNCVPCLNVGPCCQDENACNFGETYCFDDTGCPGYGVSPSGCVYDPVFLDCNETCWNDSDEDGICDELEISGCQDELACNYDVTATDGDESCVFPACLDSLALNYDPSGGCDGDCIYGCASIGDPSWISLNEGIHPAENSVVQGIQAEVEFVLNIPSTVQDGATGTPYAVSQFVIEEVTGWPSWAEAIELEGDTLEALEQICIPISGIPVSEGTYELSISGTYTVLIFDLPFEIGAVDYSAFIHVQANPDPIEGCTYELAVNYLPYATLDDGSCEFEGCADQTALNYIPYGNSFDFCVYAESICGIGLVWDDLLQTCVPSEEFVEALQINACGEGTYWNEELGTCLPINSCPEDLNYDGIVGVADLLTLLSSFGTPCDPPVDPPVAEWTCGDPVSYHGYDYQTVLIGEQCWFAENLRTFMYRNGDEIPFPISDEEWTMLEDTGDGGMAYPNESVGALNEFGALYNWNAVIDNRQLCPQGWHIPSHIEWGQMETFAGMEFSESLAWQHNYGNVGDAIKSAEWNCPAWNGQNAFGFSALPAGYRANGGYDSFGSIGYLWSSSSLADLDWSSQEDHGVFRFVTETGSYWFYDTLASGSNIGISARCIKD